MPSVLQQMLIYLLIPIIATIAGGAVAMVYSPGALLRSVVQHFAAGLIFAAVAAELLPDLLGEHAPYALIMGFTLGVVAMLGITWFTEHRGQKGVSRADKPVSLVVIAAVNFLIDGLLIGIGFVLGGKTGVLLTLALALESLFLSLAVSTALHAAGFSSIKSIAVAAGFGLLLAFGAVVGATLLGGISGRIRHRHRLRRGSPALPGDRGAPRRGRRAPYHRKCANRGDVFCRLPALAPHRDERLIA